jgi:hypothetical protein
VFVPSKLLQPCLIFEGKARKTPKMGAPAKEFYNIGINITKHLSVVTEAVAK